MGYINTTGAHQSPTHSTAIEWIEHTPPPLHNTPSRLSDRSTSGETEVVNNKTVFKKEGDHNYCIDDNDEKNMDYSTVTEPTQITGMSHLGGGPHGEDDDTTTIHSLDSIQERELSHMTEDDEDSVQRQRYDAPLNSAPVAASATFAEATSTCSVSTAPSTDEASSLGGLCNDLSSHDLSARLMTQQHRRVPSWEVSPHSQYSVAAQQQSPGSAVNLPPSYQLAWVGPQQRVASFRGEQQQQPGVTSLGGRIINMNNTGWTQQHQAPPRYGTSDHPSVFTQTAVRGGHDSQRGTYHRSININPNHAYTIQQQQQQMPPQRKPYSQPPLPPSAATPSRNAPAVAGRGHQRNLSSGSGSQTKTQSALGGVSRSSSEILKTLLRKKACLYEPDTSRAVALVTWLVGREFALHHGFFSRQQLQAGVHTCVASKIDSGIITRTKVNRCMQIILNSCFHYIIPRPDGTEENGDTFREVFAKEMCDDSLLLSKLPTPWNDIVVDRSEVLAACEDEDDQRSTKKTGYETPQDSPQLGSVQEKASPNRETYDCDDSSLSKRAVLLCFNENVRRAEDVFRCHNEFIRDTAHACHLQLSSNEWRLFFGREASSAPQLWGYVGIPAPYVEGQGPTQIDALGVMTRKELNSFRTSWCCKRYDHDHELCGFAHFEVNGGWLRRNFSLHPYKDSMCQYISTVSVPAVGASPTSNVVFINECPYGVNCDCSHSMEEIVYHPERYKHGQCSSLHRPGGCQLGDVCPKFHPAESYRFPKKSDGRSPRNSRHVHQNSANKGSVSVSTLPPGSPILYASPAPTSSFERHLLTPGLQSLFRRHGSVLRASLRDNVDVQYSFFRDDCGNSNKSKNDSGSKAICPPQSLRI